MNERIDPQTGEVTANLPATIDTTMAVAITKAELDIRITTARAFPRSIQSAVQSILSLATITEETSESMMYALPRGNKPIVGPSIRLAEVVVQCWGNCETGARVVAIDRVNKIITAEGMFTDLQTNSTTRASVEVRISDKHGRLYSDDMIATTANAARSKARRNAILAGVPKAVWHQAYEAAERCVAGDVASLAVTREKAIKAFAVYGLKPEAVFKLLDVKGEQDIGLTEVLSLRAMFSSIKNGEATVEELLTMAARGSTTFDRVANPLQDDAANRQRKGPSKTPYEQTSASVAPAGAEHAAGQQEGGGEQSIGQQTGEQVSASSGKRPTDDSAATDPIAVAHKRGQDAKAANNPRKAIPLEYRNSAERAAEADAWLAGFDGKALKGLL